MLARATGLRLEMDDIDRFWLVWRDGGGCPTRRHQDESSALVEASRLARNNIGARFYVLEATKCVAKRDVDVVYLQPPTTPF